MQSKAAIRDEARMETALVRMDRATENAREAVRQVAIATRKAEVAARRLQKRTGWTKRDETRRKIVLGSQMLWLRDSGGPENERPMNFILAHMKSLMRESERNLLDRIGTDDPPSHQEITQCKAALGGVLIAVARQGDDSGSFRLSDVFDGDPEYRELWSEFAKFVAEMAIKALHRSHDIRLFRGWELTPHG